MKFAYIAAALLPFALANPVIQDAPEDSSLAFLDARDEDAAFDAMVERDVDEAFAEVDEILAEIEERMDFEDEDEEEEMNEFEERSVGSVLKSLKKVDKAVKKVEGMVKKVHGTVSNGQALSIRSAGAKVGAALKKSTKTVKKTGHVSNGGAKKIFKYLKGNVVPDTKATLKQFQKKANSFKKGGFGPLVKSNLQQLQGLTDKESSALVKAAPKSLKKKGKKLAKSIDKAFKKAIKKY